MRLKIIFSFLGTLLVLFIVVPLLRMALSVAPADFVQTAMEKEVIASLALTLRASLWSTLTALLCGVPLAYVLARFNFSGKKIVEGLIDIPVIIPHTAAGIALLMVWGRKSIMTRLTGLSISDTEAAISMGMLFVSMPFLVNSVKEGFRLIDPRYEKTAISLGASPWQAFRTVSLPMAKKSIISGSILMWGRGISEFGAVVILAYHPRTVSVLIFERFQNYGLDFAVPVALLLILVSLMVFVVLRILGDKQ